MITGQNTVKYREVFNVLQKLQLKILLTTSDVIVTEYFI